MQTDDKGILTDRPPNPFHKSGNFGHGQMSWNEQPEFDAFEKGVQATLDHLAKVTDEELVKTLSYRFALYKYGGTEEALYPHWIRDAEQEARDFLAILSARHQKKLQEATDESSDYRRQVNEGDW